MCFRCYSILRCLGYITIVSTAFPCDPDEDEFLYEVREHYKIYLTKLQAVLLPFPFLYIVFTLSPPLPSLVFYSTFLSAPFSHSPALLQSLIQHSSLSVRKRTATCCRALFQRSLWASSTLSLLHQQPIQNCPFYFNSVGCYLKRSLSIQKEFSRTL